MTRANVSAWIEKVIIPTYGVGKPEKNPIFLQKRVYQGSSGAVYPHPVIEKIYDEKKDKEYTAVFLENEYLRIMILPELGGRIQRAFDKVRNRDFIYYNQVIKPALVGLTGPWISGGIEFNWPQHHRPSTFEPVDFDIEENTDGSKTVWVNEVELMSRTKGMAGFTLFPGKAYLQVKARLHNRSFFPQTFLWWANPAVKVNDHYQSVFPPDVHAVFDHGKRDVSDFPIATGTYYKVDYSPGTDISRYKNIPVPTSFMAVSSDYDFIGCYEHDTQAGMLHVADHHVVPGKKQWTWGNGDFGVAWDRNLTDEDGPYIELMCGSFTDNQPDFSWLQPNEQKGFEQYFMPYARVGAVKNANRDAAINLELVNNIAHIKVYATGIFDPVSISLYSGKEKIFDTSARISPSDIFEKDVPMSAETDSTTLLLEIRTSDNKLLIAYQPEKAGDKTIPPAATPAKRPSEIASNEQLFLNGLHLEQYRHATFSPVDYYQEALKRDDSDIRCNNAMGLWLLRRAQFEKAASYFRKAIKSLTLRNPNPYDGEPYYNLGVCLQMQGNRDEAYAQFYKSAWNDAMQHAAWFQLARIACSREDYEQALDFIDKSLSKNADSHTAVHLKAVLLRKLNRTEEATKVIEQAIANDRFNYGCRFERGILSGNKEAYKQLVSISRGWFNNFLEYAIDYLHAGCYQEAIVLLEIYLDINNNEKKNPLAYYYLAFLNDRLNKHDRSRELLQQAASQEPDYCFPSRIEDVMILNWAVKIQEGDHKAYYYLGNFWYANEQFSDAIECWEKSSLLNNTLPTVQRNLSLAYHNKLHSVDRSLRCMQLAFESDTKDARILMELDQLTKLCNFPAQERLQLLEKHADLVDQRDDLYLERITLYNQLGEFETARQLLARRQFHPWEGGEGKTVTQHFICHFELAKKAFEKGKYESCIQLIDEASKYPHNLGEGKLPGAQENDLLFFKGWCYEKLELPELANEFYRLATQGISEPVQAIFYNDPQPDKIIYQSLAWLRLGESEKANQIASGLITFGLKHLNDKISIDYFAVSLPDLLVFDQDLDRKNRIHCIYLQALGKLGLMEFEAANKLFNEVLQLDVNHQGAIMHRRLTGLLKQQMQTA